MIQAEYGEELVLETEVNGQIVTVDWELEGSAEYFEGETVYKNGKTYSSLTIDAVTDETCGTYICTAMTNEKTFVTKTEVRLSKEKSAEEVEGIGFVFKGTSDPSHFIFEINVGKSRIRHETTLK